jgi:exonuclease III
MKKLILVLLVGLMGMHMRAAETDSLLVMFWNLENFFDWIDAGTGDSDKEFSSYGSRGWSKRKFYTKCDAITKSILWLADEYGQLPDIIGLAEIENRGVLTKLLSSTLLRKIDYGIIHRDSKDRRGIDVALLYRKSVLNPESITFISPDSLETRDILHANMTRSDGSQIDFIVNHHPSKYGGAKESVHKRVRVMNELRNICDSLIHYHDRQILVMGDFNDTPDSEQCAIMETMLIDKGTRLHEDGRGTIRYKGRWELIDFFMTTPELPTSEMTIIEIPFLMTYDRSYPGYKPLRTYSGPRYLGGVSDHCPIVIGIE